MFKFKDSQESIMSELLLWQRTPTQTAIKDTYELKVHPTASSYDEGILNFEIPPQPRAMMTNVDITTSFKVKRGSANLGNEDQCTIINSIADSMWSLCDVVFGDRVNLTQSMRNSYAYQSFFNHILNVDKDREDFLFQTKCFCMDSGVDKADSESLVFKGDNVIVNDGASKRASRIANSKLVTVSSRLQCPLFSTSKALPANIKVRISLTKNDDKFLLMANGDDFKIILESVHLNVTYIQPEEVVLSLIEERLAKEAAPYFVTKGEIIIKPISQSGRIVRINDLFQSKIPRYAFFCVQRSSSYEGTITSNPYSFIPFGKLQIYIDGKPYFNEALEVDHRTVNGKKLYDQNGVLLRQLYKTTGRESRGWGLIDSTNIQQNFIAAVSLSGDRSSCKAPYLSPQSRASTQLLLDFGYDINVSDDMILIIYAQYDRIIKINSERELEIID